MAQYEQLNLFDLAPYIVSQIAVSPIQLEAGRDEGHKQFHDTQLELEFPPEFDYEAVDDIELEFPSKFDYETVDDIRLAA